MILDNDLETAPLREIFDQAKAHLLAQGKKSQSITRLSSQGRPMCMYRGQAGTKCAVGIFLSDEVADRNEFDPISSVQAEEGWCLTDQTFSLLEELQRVHDRTEVSAWPVQLDIVEAWFFGGVAGVVSNETPNTVKEI